MKALKKPLVVYLLAHFAILLYGLFILLLTAISKRFDYSYFCLAHDIFGIYCPFCGGSRALISLLHLDLLAALRFNAAFLISLPIVLFFDLRALARILQNRLDRPLFPKWSISLVIALFILQFVLRNLLLFGFGIDFTGDFLPLT